MRRVDVLERWSQSIAEHQRRCERAVQRVARRPSLQTRRRAIRRVIEYSQAFLQGLPEIDLELRRGRLKPARHAALIGGSREMLDSMEQCVRRYHDDNVKDTVRLVNGLFEEVGELRSQHKTDRRSLSRVKQLAQQMDTASAAIVDDTRMLFGEGARLEKARSAYERLQFVASDYIRWADTQKSQHNAGV